VHQLQQYCFFLSSAATHLQKLDLQTDAAIAAMSSIGGSTDREVARRRLSSAAIRAQVAEQLKSETLGTASNCRVTCHIPLARLPQKLLKQYGSLLPTREEALALRTKDSNWRVCIASTTDHMSEALENTLPSSERDAAKTRAMAMRDGRSNGYPQHHMQSMSKPQFWWSSRPSSVSNSVDTIMFVSKDPNVVITQIHITPLRDPNHLQNVYLWKEMIVRAFHIPPDGRDCGASSEPLNGSAVSADHSRPTDFPLAFSCSPEERDAEIESIPVDVARELDEDDENNPEMAANFRRAKWLRRALGKLIRRRRQKRQRERELSQGLARTGAMDVSLGQTNSESGESENWTVQNHPLAEITPAKSGFRTIDQVLTKATGRRDSGNPAPVFEMHLQEYDNTISKHSSATIVIEMPMPYGVVANTVSITLLGKNFEQFAGAGFLACVERVDIIGFPLNQERST
jgi:hypothetical protein